MDWRDIPPERASHYFATLSAYRGAAHCAALRHFGFDCDFKVYPDKEGREGDWRYRVKCGGKANEDQQRVSQLCADVVWYLVSYPDVGAEGICEFLKNDYESWRAIETDPLPGVEESLTIIKPRADTIAREAKVVLAEWGFSAFPLPKGN